MRLVSVQVLSAVAVLLAPTLTGQQREPGEDQAARELATMATAAGSESPARSPNLTDATALPPTIVPIHTGTDEPEAPYGIWGAALPSYKASFHGDMTFIPYLGQEYPHNQPVSWHTQSVTVGNTVLMANGEQPQRHHTDTRYEYRFGAITEAYDLTLDGLEQTFVIHDKPAATGDLVVRGRIATGMTADAFADAHRAIVWRDGAGTEIVRYGEAFTVDAAGHNEPIATSFDGEHVALTVPAATLQTATFPLVVDPLLTPVMVLSGSTGTTVDVCDSWGGQLMLVYTRPASGGDTDAFAVVVNDDFSSPVTVASDITSSWKNTSLRCATAAYPPRYCIALTRDGGTLPNSRIRFQVRAYTDLTRNNAWQQNIITPTGHQDWRLDVGGTASYSSGAHDKFLIVWQRDATSTLGGNTSTSTIRAVPVDVGGVTGVGGGTIGTVVEVPKAVAAGDAEYPSVNQEADNHSNSQGAAVWIVCWQEWSNARTEQDWDIVARQVGADSSVSSTRFFSLGARQRLGPQIAGRLGSYAVIYAAADTTQLPGKVTDSNAHGIDIQRFTWQRGRTIDTQPVVRIRDSNSYTTRRWRVGGLAYDDRGSSHWAYLSKSDGTGNLYTGRVGYHGILVDGPNRVVGLVNPPAADILGGITFDDSTERWGLAWSDYAGNIWGNQYIYPTPSAPPSTSGNSCSSATISWYGSLGSTLLSQQIGTSRTGVLLNGMPPGALSIVSIGFFTLSARLPSPLFGNGCYQNAVVLLTTDIAIGSDAVFRMPLPEFLRPADLFFQGYHTNAAGNQFLTTQRLHVPIVK